MNAPIRSPRRHAAAPPHERLLCLDIETVPDRSLLPADWGAKFPKPLWHRIACIAFVEARIEIDADGGERYAVTACRSGGELGWDEARLLASFWSYFAQEPTRVVSWNGRSFDIPVLMQRTMLHGLTARGWHNAGTRQEGYTSRFAEGWHCDLMDALASFGACARLSLDEAARAVGLPGKLGGHGSEVEAMVGAGALDQVRAYCEGDVLNLFGLYARYGLLTGRMTRAGHEAALDSLTTYLTQARATRPHLGTFLDAWQCIPTSLAGNVG